MDSNRGPLVLEATSLPTEQNHCPFLKYFCLREIIVASSSKGRASLHIRNTYPDVLKLFQHFLPTMLPTCVNEKLLFVLLKKSKVSI